MYSIEKWLSLAQSDPKMTAREFDALPLARQIELMLSTTGSNRLKLIFLSGHPEKMVRAMEEEEFFLTVHDIGLNDVAELLLLATPSQIHFLFDLDAWHRNAIEPDRALGYFQLLHEADPALLIRSLRSLDLDFLICTFRAYFDVVAHEDREAEAPTPFTVDGFHFFNPKIPERKFLLIFDALKTLWAQDLERYEAIVQGIYHGIQAEDEEAALHWRNARLQDYAIPPWEDARVIYRTIPLTKLPETRLPSLENPRFFSAYLSLPDSDSLLTQVLKDVLDQAWAGDIMLEILSLFHKEMVARYRDYKDFSAIRQALLNIHDYVNLGLEWASSRNKNQAIEVLKKTNLMLLFQAGYTLVRNLKQSSETLRKPLTLFGERWDFLDPPYDLRLKGLWRMWPIYILWDKQKGEIEKNFQTLDELNQVEQEITQAKIILDLTLRILKFDAQKFIQTQTQVPFESLRLSMLLSTGFAHVVLQEPLSALPLNADQLNLFHQRAITNRFNNGCIHMEVKSDFLTKIHAILGNAADQNHIDAMEKFVQFCFQKIEEEIGQINPNKGIDPRFVSMILVDTSKF